MLKTRTTPAPVFLTSLLLVAACAPKGGSDSPPPGPPPVIVDLVVDANRNGVLDIGDATEDADENQWSATHGAVFLANLDDDDGKGDADYTDGMVNGDADVADLAPLLVRAWPDVTDGATGVLTLDEASRANVRLMRVTGVPQSASSYQEASSDGVTLTAAELKEGAQFALEGLSLVTSDAWNGTVMVHLEVTDAAGVQVGFDDVMLRVAPLLLQFNTAPAQDLFYADLGRETRSIAQGVDAMSNGLDFYGYPLDILDLRLEWDQWAQDYFDVGYMSRPGPDGSVVGMKVAVRSAQPDRTAGEVTNLVLRGIDFGSVYIHGPLVDSFSAGYSMSSFGNWEVIPPYDKGSEHYPLGRNLFGEGERSDEHPDSDFVQMVHAQKVQPVVTVDTSFLSVGHVDEILSFVQSPSSRGWAMLTASTSLARDMFLMMQAEGHGSASLFTGKYWVDDNLREFPAVVTIDEILADADLMAASQAAQVRIDEAARIIKTEVGLTPADVTEIPFLMETTFGLAAAYQPGTVNLLHADGNVLVPDPFGPLINGKDAFKEDLKTRLGDLGLLVFFADDWDVFHRLGGEVHCGTNASRNLSALKWWESGR